MTTRRLFLAKLAALAGYPLLAKADYTKPLSLPVVVPRRVPRSLRPIVKEGLAIDHDRFLYCISAVETQHDDMAVGPCGARSRFQISEIVWKQYTAGSILFSRFSTACKGATAHAVATGHVQWLERQLHQAASPYAIAWSWKEGLEAYRRSHSNRGAMTYGATESYRRGYRYAFCVQNLYNDPTYQHS